MLSPYQDQTDNRDDQRDTERSLRPTQRADQSSSTQALDQTAPDHSTASRRWPWSARRTSIVAALWLLGAALLALLSVAAHGAGPFPGDVGIEQWAQQLHQPALVRIINFASDANWPTPAGVIAVVIIALLALARQIRAAICVAIAGFGADFVNVTLNGAVQRPRPQGGQIHAVAHLGLYSYPSGHVTHVIAFYGFLLYLTLLADRAHPAWRPLLWIVRIASLYFIIFIGPSRILEGEHWPSDVLASYLLGALTLVIGVALFHLLGMAWTRFRAQRSHDQQRLATA
jgi:undecaprenyl-diphosphatase